MDVMNELSAEKMSTAVEDEVFIHDKAVPKHIYAGHLHWTGTGPQGELSYSSATFVLTADPAYIMRMEDTDNYSWRERLMVQEARAMPDGSTSLAPTPRRSNFLALSTYHYRHCRSDRSLMRTNCMTRLETEPGGLWK